MLMNNIKLSLVIPCYNEEGNVRRFFDEVNKVFDGKVSSYEFVFVDDGSKDNTYKNLKTLYNENRDTHNIQVLSFSRNFGKESAIFAGLSNAKGEAVCLIDADLQQRPEVVLKMLDVMNSDDELDCVTAYQDKRKEGRIISAFKSVFYKIINKMSDIDFVNGASDFRLMKRKMVDAIVSMSEYHRFSKGIFSWIGFNTEYIPYEVAKREVGETKWNFKKLFKYAVDGLVSFSTFPLKISAILGFFLSIISILYLIVVVVQKIAFGIDIPGYATIIVLMLLIGGVQLFSLGVIGEYLSKTYIQGKNRPIYILRNSLGSDDKNK